MTHPDARASLEAIRQRLQRIERDVNAQWPHNPIYREDCLTYPQFSVRDVQVVFAELDRVAALLAPAVPHAPEEKSPDDTMDIYVPGAWRCLSCGFQLSQATIFMGSGEIGCARDQVMKMSGESCPNDEQPMVRVTWRDRAEDNRKWGEALMEDIIAIAKADHLPGALETLKAAVLYHAQHQSCPPLAVLVDRVEARAYAVSLPAPPEEADRQRLWDAIIAVDAIEHKNGLENGGDLAERIDRIGAELDDRQTKLTEAFDSEVEWAASPAVPPSPEPTWQTVATAPRDGTAFYAYAPDFIDADFNPNGVIEAVFDGESRFIGAIWNGVHDIWNTQFVEPTHWRRFPVAPEPNVEEILAPEFQSIGTVEGFLQGLITHGKNRFLIVDPLSGRQITGYFSDRIPWKDVHAAYGQRVAATGTIRSRRDGAKVSIVATRLYVFPPENELPTAADVLGILKAAK